MKDQDTKLGFSLSKTDLQIRSKHNAVADLGLGKWGQLPPFTMKTKLWCPLFGKKSAPYPDPNALFFQWFIFNAGKHVN